MTIKQVILKPLFYKKGKIMSVIFEMNRKSYKTDEETLNVLRGIASSAKKSNDMSAVIAVMALGLKTGRITEIKG